MGRTAAVLGCFLTIVLLLPGCRIAAPAQPAAFIPPTALVQPTAERTPTSPAPTLTRAASPSPEPTPAPAGLWVDPNLPPAALAALKIPPGFLRTDDPRGSLRLAPGGQHPVSQWVYALVAPFPTVADGVSSSDLLRCWQGQPTGPFAGKPLWMDSGTRAVLTAVWGEPDSDSVQLVSSARLIESLWAAKSGWGIVPFEDLDPRLKVLEVNGISPVRRDFNLSQYALTIPLSIEGDSAASLLQGTADGQPLLPSSNRLADRLSVVALTGTTAIIRGVAATIRNRGVLYPAKDILPWLRAADIVHVSSEAIFAQNCPLYMPTPGPGQTLHLPCSEESNLAVLENIGTSVVELTGDHFIDYPAQDFLHTLDLFRQRGWQYYGGGENLSDAQRPALFENHGNRIAFIGCNAKGRGYAHASATTPGAAFCDLPLLEGTIANLRQQGYVVIFTFQHLEWDTHEIDPAARPDFERMAAAGAAVVSGSQGHLPQAMEFDPTGAFLHYGLGNLFLDQITKGPDFSQSFIDRHIIYNGHYISTELLTMQFVDLARPRPMTAEERAELLKIIFQASGW